LNIEIHFRDTRLQPIWKKVQAGERLSFDDGKVLFQTPDVYRLGRWRILSRKIEAEMQSILY